MSGIQKKLKTLIPARLLTLSAPSQFLVKEKKKKFAATRYFSFYAREINLEFFVLCVYLFILFIFFSQLIEIFHRGIKKSKI